MKKQLLTAATTLFILTSPVAFSQEVTTNASNEPAGVVGGSNADPEEFPWMVSLVTTDGNPGCGASLIAPNWVLTAAHCVMFGDIDRVLINSVTVDMDAIEDHSELIEVDEIFQHDGYSMFEGTGPDIALIRLVENSTIIPVGLAETADADSYAAEMPAQVLGWGKTAPGGSPVDSLLHADCIFLGNDTCDEMSSYYNLNEGGNICAGYFEGMTPGGAAQGDSGGPLFYEDDAGNFKQVGIVSGGDIDATTEDSPGVFTLVSQYTDWIETTMEEEDNAASIMAENREAIQITQYTGDRIEVSGINPSEKYHVDIYDLSGKQINHLTSENEANTIVIPTGHLTPGMYALQLVNQSNGKLTREKFIVN